MMDRMPGRYSPPYCPYCKTKSGPDCPTESVSPRQVRLRLKRELRQEQLRTDERR